MPEPVSSNHVQSVPAILTENEIAPQSVPSPPFTDIVQRSIGQTLREDNGHDSVYEDQVVGRALVWKRLKSKLELSHLFNEPAMAVV